MSKRPELSADMKYRLLSRISQEIRDTLDVDEILEHLLDVIKSVLDYDAAGVFVFNAGKVYPRHGPPESVIAGISMRGFDPHPIETDAMLMKGKGIVGHVIRTGQSVVAKDVRLDPHYIPGRERTRSEIAVPILKEGRTVGALNLESDRLGAYDEYDLEALRFFADAAAISISKAMLHQQLLVKERIEEQLRIAHVAQARLLPSEPPRVGGFDVAGMCLPAFDLGGDYFDWIDLPGGALGVVVADVSGKGVSAALIMSAFRALLRVFARDGLPLTDLMVLINRHLRESTGAASFVTAAYGVLDPATGSLAYVNCGHNHPILLRADGSAEILGGVGSLLGVFDDVSFEVRDFVLDRGDLLVLYTDGIVENENESGDPLGSERLVTLVREAARLPAAEMIQGILAGARAFCGVEQFDDDVTLVILKREPH
jgi:sigma-B regulation protein RsbU (phosphoserine phosphatase)